MGWSDHSGLNQYLSEHLRGKCSLLCLPFRPASEKRVNERMRGRTRLRCCCLGDTAFYLSAPMLPTILTAPMMPMRLYLDKVLESCLRITMCMSSWGEGGVGSVMRRTRRMKKRLCEGEPGCASPAAADRRPACWGGGRVCGSAPESGCPCSPKFPASRVG